LLLFALTIYEIPAYALFFKHNTLASRHWSLVIGHWLLCWKPSFAAGIFL